MKNMSTLKFLTGGLVSGLILNIGGITLVYFFLSDQVQQMVERFGGLPSWAPLAHVAMRFAVGFGALWIFIATHARFERPFPALLVATCVSWALAYPVPLELWWSLGTFTSQAILLAAVWGFLELLVATLAGWLTAGKP